MSIVVCEFKLQRANNDNFKLDQNTTSNSTCNIYENLGFVQAVLNFILFQVK